jgi:hypothetical protein
VLHDQHPERIRLNGIDCPEKGQAYGQRAKQAASELVYGKEVTLQTHGFDKYGRTLADVLLPDGMNLNQELVKISARDFANLLDPSGTRQVRLVLVVSEVCAGEYDAREARSRGARGENPWGIAEGTSSHPLGRYVNFLCSSPLRLLCLPPMRSRSRS